MQMIHPPGRCYKVIGLWHVGVQPSKWPPCVCHFYAFFSSQNQRIFHMKFMQVRKTQHETAMRKALHWVTLLHCMWPQFIIRCIVRQICGCVQVHCVISVQKKQCCAKVSQAALGTQGTFRLVRNRAFSTL